MLERLEGPLPVSALGAAQSPSLAQYTRPQSRTSFAPPLLLGIVRERGMSCFRRTMQ
jgi:hypothetical protein